MKETFVLQKVKDNNLRSKTPFLNFLRKQTDNDLFNYKNDKKVNLSTENSIEKDEKKRIEVYENSFLPIIDKKNNANAVLNKTKSLLYGKTYKDYILNYNSIIIKPSYKIPEEKSYPLLKNINYVSKHTQDMYKGYSNFNEINLNSKDDDLTTIANKIKPNRKKHSSVLMKCDELNKKITLANNGYINFKGTLVELKKKKLNNTKNQKFKKLSLHEISKINNYSDVKKQIIQNKEGQFLNYYEKHHDLLKQMAIPTETYFSELESIEKECIAYEKIKIENSENIDKRLFYEFLYSKLQQLSLLKIENFTCLKEIDIPGTSNIDLNFTEFISPKNINNFEEKLSNKDLNFSTLRLESARIKIYKMSNSILEDKETQYVVIDQLIPFDLLPLIYCLNIIELKYFLSQIVSIRYEKKDLKKDESEASKPIEKKEQKIQGYKKGLFSFAKKEEENVDYYLEEYIGLEYNRTLGFLNQNGLILNKLSNFIETLPKQNVNEDDIIINENNSEVEKDKNDEFNEINQIDNKLVKVNYNKFNSSLLDLKNIYDDRKEEIIKSNEEITKQIPEKANKHKYNILKETDTFKPIDPPPSHNFHFDLITKKNVYKIDFTFPICKFYAHLKRIYIKKDIDLLFCCQLLQTTFINWDIKVKLNLLSIKEYRDLLRNVFSTYNEQNDHKNGLSTLKVTPKLSLKEYTKMYIKLQKSNESFNLDKENLVQDEILEGLLNDKKELLEKNYHLMNLDKIILTGQEEQELDYYFAICRAPTIEQTFKLLDKASHINNLIEKNNYPQSSTIPQNTTPDQNVFFYKISNYTLYLKKKIPMANLNSDFSSVMLQRVKSNNVAIDNLTNINANNNGKRKSNSIHNSSKICPKVPIQDEFFTFKKEIFFNMQHLKIIEKLKHKLDLNQLFYKLLQPEKSLNLPEFEYISLERTLAQFKLLYGEEYYKEVIVVKEIRKQTNLIATNNNSEIEKKLKANEIFNKLKNESKLKNANLEFFQVSNVNNEIKTIDKKKDFSCVEIDYILPKLNLIFIDFYYNDESDSSIQKTPKLLKKATKQIKIDFQPVILNTKSIDLNNKISMDTPTENIVANKNNKQSNLNSSPYKKQKGIVRLQDSKDLNIKANLNNFEEKKNDEPFCQKEEIDIFINENFLKDLSLNEVKNWGFCVQRYFDELEMDKNLFKIQGNKKFNFSEYLNKKFGKKINERNQKIALEKKNEELSKVHFSRISMSSNSYKKVFDLVKKKFKLSSF